MALGLVITHRDLHDMARNGKLHGHVPREWIDNLPNLSIMWV